MTEIKCQDCGMPVAAGEYHPFAACLMFKACHNSNTVRANLQAVQDQNNEARQLDTMRLDFLDRMNFALNQHYGTTYGWELILSPHVTRLLAGSGSAGHIGWLDLHDSKARGVKSCREAIDAALSRSALGREDAVNTAAIAAGGAENGGEKA